MVIYCRDQVIRGLLHTSIAEMVRTTHFMDLGVESWECYLYRELPRKSYHGERVLLVST